MANTWAQFKSNVLARMSDVPQTDDLYGMACGMYVKYYLCREVDHDLTLAQSYYTQYRDLRRKLLGYQTTLIPGSTLDPVVRVYLPVDTNRQGVQTLITQLIKNAYQEMNGLNPFLDKTLREAVVDIQTLIPAYRVTSTTDYGVNDLVVVGGLSRGQLPTGAQLYEGYLLQENVALAENVPYQIGQFIASNGRTYMVLQSGLLPTGTLGAGLQTTDGSVEVLGGCTFTFQYFEPFLRSRCKQYDWHQRYDFNWIKLNCQSKRLPSAIMIDLDTYSFYVWPQVTSTDSLTYQITWTAPTISTNIQDAQLVPFDDEVESTVAEFLWLKYYSTIDKDSAQAKLHGMQYNDQRGKLFAEGAAKLRVMDTK